MRITIDVDGGSVRAAGTSQERSHEIGEPIDGGGPPSELLEALALEGALGPVATQAGALSAASVAAGGPAPPTTRGVWETGTLMKKRRD